MEMGAGWLGSDWMLANPEWLLVLALVPLVRWWRGRRPERVMVLPFAGAWSGRERLERSPMPEVLVVVGLIALAFALARPQRVEDRREVQQKGYDIVLAIDLSGSMLAEDYREMGRRINRLQAIKPIIEAFTERRSGDRIGVVAFGGRAYTLAPLSFDHPWLRRQIARLSVGLVEDGTAVGDALALAVSRLNQPERQEGGKRLGGFVILLTDGANNSGLVDPLEAATLAQAKGIPVYTIGAGKEGIVPMPTFDRQGRKIGYRRARSELDEETLREIAQRTGARYFRARDKDTVEQAFEAIDRERMIEFDARSRLTIEEFFEVAAVPGGLLFLAGIGFARWDLRRTRAGTRAGTTGGRVGPGSRAVAGVETAATAASTETSGMAETARGGASGRAERPRFFEDVGTGESYRSADRDGGGDGMG